MKHKNSCLHERRHQQIYTKLKKNSILGGYKHGKKKDQKNEGDHDLGDFEGQVVLVVK